MSTPHQSSELSTKARNDRKWEVYKDHIRHVYMELDHTLKETMTIIQKAHHFRASERKWKEKLKGWKFEKNISSADMCILIAKRDKRERDEGKKTKFFHSGNEIKSVRFENFKKRKTTKLMDVASPTAETPADITYCTPGPELQFSLIGMEDISPLDQIDVKMKDTYYPIPVGDLPGPGTGTRVPSPYLSTLEEELPAFLPPPSNQTGQRHMLIETISTHSILWNCPGRGLHTIDEESVIGVDDEILTPSAVSDLIENHIKGARIDHENNRTKSAVVKYLGAIMLALERKCCGQETLLEYLMEFLDLLEVGPGAYVSALLKSLENPIFQASEYSEVFLVYHEVLTLLRNEFEPTTEVVARICVLLADLEALYPEILYRAQALYGVAIEAYERMGKFDHMLQCQLSLANILISLNRFSDGYELLARACCKYLQYYLDPWVEGKPSPTGYRLSSLFPASPGVRPSTFRLQRILSQRIEEQRGSGAKHHLYIMMLHEITSLGGILSVEANRKIGMFSLLEALDPLWSELFGKISLLDNTFAQFKGFAYIQRSNYLAGSFSTHLHPNCLDDITAAHYYLSEGGYLRPDHKDQLLHHIKGIELQLVDYPIDNILGMTTLSLMARGLSDLSCPSFPEMLEQQPSILDMKDPNDLFERAFIRQKYGVRYNGSNNQGLCFTD